MDLTRGIIVTIALTLAPQATLPAADTAKPAKPNIVFILADDLGWKDVGYAGSSFYRTPNYPVMGGKNSPFEGGTRVPLAIRWPAVVKPGTSCPQRVIGMAFYPTVLAAAGLPLMPQQHADGVSLLPVLSGSGMLPERPLVVHFPHYSGSTGPNSLLIVNDWKPIRFYNDETGRYLLYNLAEDPFEQHDLSALEPDRVRTLDEQLTRLLDDMKAQMPRKNPAYEPDSKHLPNRESTLNLARQQREVFAERLNGTAPLPENSIDADGGPGNIEP